MPVSTRTLKDLTDNSADPNSQNDRPTKEWLANLSPRFSLNNFRTSLADFYKWLDNLSDEDLTLKIEELNRRRVPTSFLRDDYRRRLKKRKLLGVD